MTATLGDRILEPDRRCGYVPFYRGPRCERLAAVHALIQTQGNETSIGMAACAKHQPSLHDVGWIRDMHPFGPGCAHPVSDWGRDGCLPGM